MPGCIISDNSIKDMDNQRRASLQERIAVEDIEGRVVVLKASIKSEGRIQDDALLLAGPSVHEKAKLTDEGSCLRPKGVPIVSYLKQGRPDWYTPTAIARRRKLSEHPDVLEEIDIFWDTFSDINLRGSIPRHAYLSLHKRFTKALYSKYDDRMAMDIALKDWNRDVRSSRLRTDVMSKRQFRRALFELVDTWTDSLEVAAYLEFLKELYRCCAEPKFTSSKEAPGMPVDGRRYHWRMPKDVILMDDSKKKRSFKKRKGSNSWILKRRHEIDTEEASIRIPSTDVCEFESSPLSGSNTRSIVKPYRAQCSPPLTQLDNDSGSHFLDQLSRQKEGLRQRVQERLRKESLYGVIPETIKTAAIKHDHAVRATQKTLSKPKEATKSEPIDPRKRSTDDDTAEGGRLIVVSMSAPGVHDVVHSERRGGKPGRSAGPEEYVTTEMPPNTSANVPAVTTKSSPEVQPSDLRKSIGLVQQIPGMSSEKNRHPFTTATARCPAVKVACRLQEPTTYDDAAGDTDDQDIHDVPDSEGADAVMILVPGSSKHCRYDRADMPLGSRWPMPRARTQSSQSRSRPQALRIASRCSSAQGPPGYGFALRCAGAVAESTTAPAPDASDVPRTICTNSAKEGGFEDARRQLISMAWQGRKCPDDSCTEMSLPGCAGIGKPPMTAPPQSKRSRCRLASTRCRSFNQRRNQCGIVELQLPDAFRRDDDIPKFGKFPKRWGSMAETSSADHRKYRSIQPTSQGKAAHSTLRRNRSWSANVNLIREERRRSLMSAGIIGGNKQSKFIVRPLWK